MTDKQQALVRKLMKQNGINVFSMTKNTVAVDCFYSDFVMILQRALKKHPDIHCIGTFRYKAAIYRVAL